MNNEIIVRVNPVELVQLQEAGGDMVVNPQAEEAIVRLLELQKEVNAAVDAVKSEIERQALEFNPHFTAARGDKIKINYSASGAKYKDAGTAKNHRNRFWTKKVVWSLNSKAIDEYRAKQRRLPQGIVEVPRTKTIRISEANYAG